MLSGNIMVQIKANFKFKSHYIIKVLDQDLFGITYFYSENIVTSFQLHIKITFIKSTYKAHEFGNNLYIIFSG